MHQTQFQVLERNGRPPEPNELGWEDTIFFKGRDTVDILARFNTYTNPDIPYMLHCHILDHEDTGMMSQFEIVDSREELEGHTYIWTLVIRRAQFEPISTRQHRRSRYMRAY